jgi:hypothetical protein
MKATRRSFLSYLPVAIAAAGVPKQLEAQQRRDVPQVVGNPICTCGYFMLADSTRGDSRLWYTQDFYCTNKKCPNFEKRFTAPTLAMIPAE